MEFASDIRRRRHVDQATRRTSASNPTRNTERGVVIRSLDFGTRRQETHTSTPGSFYGNSRCVYHNIKFCERATPIMVECVTL